MELIGPFTRRGRQVDLAASDRLERRLAFKPRDHDADPPGVPGIRETLVLEHSSPGGYRLTRRLTAAGGLTAGLEAEGSDPGDLLARIEAVAPRHHFRTAGGFAIAVSYRLERVAGASGVTPAAPHLRFTRGLAQVLGLTVTLEASPVRGMPAAVKLIPEAGELVPLPEDTLAVLGAAWGRLRDADDGWAGEVRLRGREPARSRRAEAALERAAAHLAQLLVEAPGRFHERWVLARWRVFCRRLMPLSICIALILCAAAVPKLHLAENSGLRMLILNSPPILMMLFFCLREIPTVEIPPLPRRSTAAVWRAPRMAPTGREASCSATR